MAKLNENTSGKSVCLFFSVIFMIHLGCFDIFIRKQDKIQILEY